MQTSAGVAVVCGIPAAQPMTQVLQEYGRPMAALLAAELNVVIDAGRLTPDTPALHLLAASTVVVIVLPDRHEALYRLTDLLPGLNSVLRVEQGVRSAVMPVVVADARRGAEAAREVDELLGQRNIPARPARWLPRDEKAAAAARGGLGRAARSALVKSARSLAEGVAAEQDLVAEQRAQRDRLAVASRTDAAAQWRGVGVGRGA
jgi:cellulose biosynthesis protein BcsQ